MVFLHHFKRAPNCGWHGNGLIRDARIKSVPFRKIDRTPRCKFCHESAKLSCAICQRPICAAHRIEDACIDCASDEYVAEAKLARGGGKWILLHSALIFPGFFLGIAMESAALACSVYFGGVAIAGATEFIRRHRRKKRRQLLEPSKPRALPAADSQKKPDAGH